MKIGVFGGTFNPVHNAHIHLAKRFYELMELDKVVLIPTFIPPHKPPKDLADATCRLEMCELAALEHPGFEVCGYEIEQGGKSYTYRTLKHLAGIYAGADFYLLMGGDMFLTVQDWRHPGELYKIATLCAAGREIGEYSALETQALRLKHDGARCVLLNIEPVPMSSTEIREKIRNGQDVSDLLTPSVLEYIRKNGLYV